MPAWPGVAQGYTRAASEETRRAALWLWGGVLLVFVGQARPPARPPTLR